MDRDLGATGGTVERCSETDQAGVGGREKPLRRRVAPVEENREGKLGSAGAERRGRR